MSSDYIYNSVEKKNQSFSNRMNVKQVELLFPDNSTIEKAKFNVGSQLNSQNSGTYNLGSDHKFYITNSFQAVDNFYLEILTNATNVTYPTVLTAFNFIKNIRVKQGSNILLDNYDGKALAKNLLLINNFSNKVGTYLQSLGPTGAQTTAQRILIPLAGVLMYQGKFNNSNLHSTETQKNLASFPLLQNKTIEITISLNPSTAIVSAGTVTISAVNLIFKSFSYNDMYNPVLPWGYIGTRLISDSYDLTLTSGVAQTQAINSIITSGEINCLLISFVTSTNMGLFDYQNCLKTSISKIIFKVRDVVLFTLDESLSIPDSNYIENEELGTSVQMLPQSNANPFFIIPLSLLSDEISNVGSSGINLENEKSINLIITSSANVSYTMLISAVYKQITYIDKNGNVETSL
jgi:hypothetical protein